MVQSIFTPINIQGPSSSATFDAQISVPDGGSENFQGTLQLQAGAVLILSYDGSPHVRIVSVPNATDQIGLEGGTSGGGGTVYSYNASSTSSPLNLVSQGLGNINLASGAGLLASFVPPTVPVTNTLTLTPGTGITNAGAASIVVGSGGNECSLNVLFTAFASGIAIGPSGANAPVIQGARTSFVFGQNASITGGSHSVCMGYYTQAYRGGNFVCGYTTRDVGRQNSFFFSSGNLVGFGDQQLMITMLRGKLTGNGSIRLTNDAQAAAGYNCGNLPASSSSRAGLYTLKAIVLKNTTDAASFYADNVFMLNVAGTLTFVSGSPTSMTAGPASAGATGISIALSADTVNLGLNATVTVTGGLSTDVYACDLTLTCTENGGLT